MPAAALIVFRESLEAALVVAVVLGYLARTGQDALKPMAWAGVAAGIGASAAGAALILTLVLWMGRRGGSAAALEARLAAAGGTGTVAGAAIGLAAAVALAAALFLSARRGSLRGFFAATNVLLILFAAGLVSRGMHELIEAGALPPLVERLWDLDPPARADGSLPALHQGGAVGGSPGA